MINIIITVTDMERNYSYDMEIPLQIKTGIIIQKIIEVVSAINPMARIIDSTIVMDERTGKTLEMDKTIEDNNVWNGDYLIFI